MGITRWEGAVLCLTALFCLTAAGTLSRTAARLPRVQFQVQRAAPPEQDVEHHALMDGERINVNTADSLDLQRLPGIGEKRARAILEYREAHGDFVCIEEFLLIPGIGEHMLEEIRLYAEIG